MHSDQHLNRIAVTMGDPAGIGGEVILKALGRISKIALPVIVGDLSVLESVAAMLSGGDVPIRPFRKGTRGEAEIFDVGALREVQLGASDAQCGAASYRYIAEGLRLAFSGDVAGIVTCPINKKSIQAAGVPFMGHTELLSHHAGVTNYIMMMTSGSFRVSLVTIHVPLKEVPSLVTAQRVFQCIAVTARSLKSDFGLAAPRIKVCGVNPHAGEQGVIGTEETAVTEGIEMAKRAGINATGPFPADSLFHRLDCDAYCAMYHDQGLIPVKTIGFSRAVNITLGLPFVRTSVGHGTGLDIAGKGLADPTSLIEAFRTAASMIRSRSR